MSELRAKVMAALDKIGHVNGTKPPESQDPLDGVAYEYMIASAGSSYFDKRKKNALEALQAQLIGQPAAKLLKTITRVTENGIKEDVDLAKGQMTSVMAEVKSGASYVDIDALRVALKKKMKTSEVDQLFLEVTKKRSPSVGYRVGETE